MGAAFEDLPVTAYNRPGLPRIAYAGEDFHDLRARLLERMSEAFPRWNPELAANTSSADMAVVFIELFSRMAAVLATYSDARANEGFLRTAVLPRSLIDLAQLVDYRLAPGASASALQVFLAKEAKSGTVPAGYKVQAGSLVFETSAALEVAAARNELRLAGFNRSGRQIRVSSSASATQDCILRLDQAYPALKAAGQPIVLDDGVNRIPIPLASVTQNQGMAEIAWAPGAAKLDPDLAIADPTCNLAIADLTVYAGPKQAMRLAAAARADEIALATKVLPVANAGLFSTDGVVLITADGVQMPAKVAARSVTAGTITLHRGLVASMRRSRVRVYKGVRIGRLESGREAKEGAGAARGKGDEGSAPSGSTEIGVHYDSSTLKPNPGDLLLLADQAGVELATVASTAEDTIYLARPLPRVLGQPPGAQGKATGPAPVLFVVALSDPQAPVTTLTPMLLGELSGIYSMGNTALDLDRAYEELKSGMVVAAGDGSKLGATTILANEAIDGKTRLTLAGELDRGMRVGTLAVYGPFRFAARVDGYDRSESTLAAGATQLELAAAATGLAPGAHLLVAGGGAAESARVSLVSESQGKTLVSLARALEEAYPLVDTVIYGNAVPVTHGEGAPEEVLGSGDPSQPAQRFLLRRSPLAFVPDPAAERGVRAALEVFVGDERWTEVSNLAASSESDQHYVLDIDENERAFVQFGDGVFGAQPASGRNNIRARYRVGHGLAGNVAAASIAQMPQALPFLESTFNGGDAGGGAERESPPDARRSVQHRVRTLGRAVSLADYADLALTFGGIAKARADWEWHDGRRGVLLTLAAAGGAAPSAELKDALYAFFAERSAAGGRLRIRDHRNLPVRLALDVTVQPNFLQADVLRRLWQALGAEEDPDGGRGYFHFDARELGEDLFLSSVYRLVETTRGVRNALAIEFHIEGEGATVADRIAIPADALATGGHATDPARGRLSLRLSGGIT
jgi:hypothetical protein